MTKVKRNFKDSLFRLSVSKEELLSLYNAVRRKFIYECGRSGGSIRWKMWCIGMKNDVSFLFAHYLNLYYEAQSTSNQTCH